MTLADFSQSDHPEVAILMGSETDLPTMAKAYKILEEFGVPVEMRVISAHRNPEGLHTFVSNAPARGVKVFICGAGMAAHLAGVVASLTTLPVIGVPCQSTATGGLDSLLSVVQMPKGVPVATVAIDGGQNAGILAVQILALGNPGLAKKLSQYKKGLAGH